MDERDDDATPAPGLGLEALVVEVPLHTHAELVELEAAADEVLSDAARLAASARRLRSKARFLKRVREEAEAQYGAPTPGPVLRLVPASVRRNKS